MPKISESAVLSLLRGSLLLVLGISFYISRWVWLQPWDFKYLSNAYDHSQWRIPLSTRILSDNELYQVAGHRLWQNADLFDTNPEVPPMGKYLYGAASHFLNNPYWMSASLYIVGLLAFYWVTYLIIKNKILRLVAILILITSPLLVAQLSQTMLDLPQVVFLLLHVGCMMNFFTLLTEKKSKGLNFTQIKWLGAAGLALGAFSATKIPLFAPVILGIDGVWLLLAGTSLSGARTSWWKLLQPRILLIGILGAATALTYTATYIMYFINDHNLLEWLRAQKWMVDFYANSDTTYVPGTAVITLGTGWFKTWWSDQQWYQVPEWTPVWPITLAATLVVAIKQRLQLNKISYIATLALALASVQVLTPFWPRYYLLVLPFTIIGFVFMIEQRWAGVHFHRQRIFGVIIGLIMFYSLGTFGWYLRPQPTEIAGAITHNWDNGHYQDLYTFLSLPFEPQALSRDEFYRRNKIIDHQLRVSDTIVKLAIEPVSVWNNTAPAIILIERNTPLGLWQLTQPAELKRQSNHWQLQWDWSLLAPGMEENDQLALYLDQVSAGTLKTSDGIILSQPATAPFITIIPGQANITQEFIADVSQLTGIGRVQIEKTLQIEALGELPVDIGFVSNSTEPIKLSLTEAQRLPTFQKVSTQPGVHIEFRPSRQISNQAAAADLTTAIQQIEAVYPKLEPIQGGYIELIKTNGTRQKLFTKTSQNGRDVTLSQTFNQLKATIQ